MEALAQSWLVDPPWQKVFKHTFNVVEEYVTYLLISVGTIALSVKLLTTLATGDLACMLIGVVDAPERGNLLPYASGGGIAMINFAQTQESCINNVYSQFMQYLPYIMLLQTLVLVIVEKFAFRFPRIAQKVERFYKNIVEDSLFGKDPDVTEDMMDPKKSTEAISRRRQRNEICMLMKRSSFIHDMYIGKNVIKSIIIGLYIFGNISFVTSGVEFPTRCAIPIHEFPDTVEEEGTVMFQCKAKKLSFFVTCLWVQNCLFVLHLTFSIGCIIWTWHFRPVTNLIRTINTVRQHWEASVVKAQDGKDFLFLFDLLAHSCGLESTLRVLTHSDINFFQICKPRLNVERDLTIRENFLKISWEPADIERWLHSKKHRRSRRMIEIDSYEVTIFPAESCNNTMSVLVDQPDNVGSMEYDGKSYYALFEDLDGGKTEYVVTIACMIGKSRMKGERVVTVLVPHGPEKPSTGMLKSAGTNQVEIFWDPPKGEFSRYILVIERIFDRPTASVSSLLKSKTSNMNIHDGTVTDTDKKHIREMQNLSNKLSYYTIMGLDPGERYKIELGTQTGTISTEHAIFDVVMTRPMPVMGLMTDSVTSTSFTIHWAIPDGHPCLKGFQIHVANYDGKAFKEITVSKSQKSFKFYGLTGGYDYDVTLKALCYFEGLRTESEPTSVSTTTIPEPVKNLRLENATSNSIFVRWDTYTPIGVSSHRHKLTIECAKINYSHTVEVSGEKQHFHFSRLPEADGAGQAYKVSVVLAVVTPRDNEVQSVAVTDTFATLPMKPGSLRPTENSNEPTLTWTRSPTAHVTGYRVRWRTTEEGARIYDAFVEQEEDCEELSFVVPGLEPDVVYKVNVHSVIELEDGSKVESKELPEKMVWKDGERLVHVEEMSRKMSTVPGMEFGRQTSVVCYSEGTQNECSCWHGRRPENECSHKHPRTKSTTFYVVRTLTKHGNWTKD